MSDLRAELDALVAEHGGERVEDLRGDHAYVLPREKAHGCLQALKEASFEFCSFITAVDNYLDEPRFEVIYRLRSLTRNVDVRVNVPVPGDDAEVDTVTDLFPAANWMEREVWDMFGVRFQGHPNLERILMWEGFEAHPLRKDYPLLGNTPGTPGYVGKGGKL